MNKQEAIEKIEKGKSNFNAWEDLVRNRALDDALDIVKQLDEPEKPVVPKFVAEWIEDQKESFSDASAIHMYDNLTLDNSNGYYHEVWLWVIAHHHDFIKAWHDGYTVEKEKLYTVKFSNEDFGKTYIGIIKTANKIGISTVPINDECSKCYFTKSELEEFKFWNNPAFEIKEVTE
jgi:hypothetical protein